MKHLLILLIVLGASGCTVFDAPKFQPTQYNTDLHIKVEFMKDFTVLEKLFGVSDLDGMTEYKDFKGTCVLYILPLEEVMDSYTMCVAGHEFFHCILGSYHKEGEGDTC